MKVELAKEYIEFEENLNSKQRMKEIISEIHNVCISDIHFQNDQLSNISSELEELTNNMKSKKIVLDEAIKTVDKITKNNKKMMYNIEEYRERLLNEMSGII